MHVSGLEVIVPNQVLEKEVQITSPERGLVFLGQSWKTSS